MPKRTDIKSILIIGSMVAMVFLITFGLPATAYANVALPLLAVRFPYLITMLAPVIFIEANIYRALLRTSYRRAFVAAAAANGASTIIGIPLYGGWVFPGPQEGSGFYWQVPLSCALGLLIAYPISVSIEWDIAKRFFEPHRSVAVHQATRQANRITYGLLLVLVACWLSRNVVWVQKHLASSEAAYKEMLETLRSATSHIRQSGTGHGYVHRASEGLALVVDTGQHPYRYRYVDERGQTVVTFKGVESEDFHEGLARARDYVKGSLRWGYIDRSGQYVISPQFDECKDFSEGVAAVGIIGERGRAHGLSDWGYIDKTGRRLIPLRFRAAESFSEGLAAVLVDDQWGYIDEDGGFVIAPQFDGVSRFSGNTAIVMHEDGLSFTEIWSFIDKTGSPLQRPDVQPGIP